MRHSLHVPFLASELGDTLVVLEREIPQAPFVSRKESMARHRLTRQSMLSTPFTERVSDLPYSVCQMPKATPGCTRAYLYYRDALADDSVSWEEHRQDDARQGTEDSLPFARNRPPAHAAR